MTRKERRAEKFGHMSKNRVNYQTDPFYIGIQTDIEDARIEMTNDVRNSRINAYFNNTKGPHCDFRNDSFYFAH